MITALTVGVILENAPYWIKKRKFTCLKFTEEKKVKGRCHRRSQALKARPSVDTVSTFPSQCLQHQLVDHYTAPSNVCHGSSEKPRSHPSEHNQFLLQWSTMRPLQPLTPPSVLLPQQLAAPRRWASALPWNEIGPCVCRARTVRRSRWRRWQRVIYSAGLHVTGTVRQTGVVSHFGMSDWRSLRRLAVSIAHGATKG